MFEISPNTEVIEYLLSGNYKPGHLTTIYGNAASGKTTSCLLAAISCAKKKYKTIFVDTESGFSTKRLEQLTNERNLLDYLFLIQPKSFQEQHHTILKLKKLCNNEKIKLIIIDTIGSHYRVKLNSDYTKINSMLVLQLKNLVRIARDLNKVVIITNQVYSKLGEKDQLGMVGGSIIPHMSRCVIELKKTDQKRFASIVKHKMPTPKTTYYRLGKKIEFEIKEKGLSLV